MNLKYVCVVLAVLVTGSMAQTQGTGSEAQNIGVVSGSGTPNSIPMWTGTFSLGNSILFQGGGNIGIGTKRPGGKLDVENNSSTQSAIFAQNASTTGNINGVFGITNSPQGNGVLGINNATSGYAAGVTGISNSNGGPGVNGFSTSPTGGWGVYGAAATSGIAVEGQNQYCSDGICNIVPGTAGMFVTAPGGTILLGVDGSSFTTVFSVDSSGNGFFAGNLSKASGSFKIDHPVDPANKYLEHSFVESPDMMNIYNGIVVLDEKGEASVRLPDYFEALNRDFRYQLTSIGAPGPNLYIAEEISGNRFQIAGGKPHAKVSWQVTGVRQDAYANAHRIKVEQEKPAAERGHYLHPELFGAGEKQAVGTVHPPMPQPPIAALQEAASAAR